VAIADLDEPGGALAAAQIVEAGGEAIAVGVDVADETSVVELFARVRARWGRLDVLDNGAALTDPDHQRADSAVADLDELVWQRTLSVDLTGTMLCCKHAVPELVASGGGSIINISSNSALGGDLTLTAYAAAKAGVNSITRSVATAYGKSGVRCNTVSPGGIRSPSLAANVPAEVVAMMADQCLLPELGQPQDVADLCLFLASDESRYITGQVIRVDGGLLSHLPHVAGLRAAAAAAFRSTSAAGG